MKIAVMVKEVPDSAAPRRLDPETLRLERSGEPALNRFDVHAVEEALRGRLRLRRDQRAALPVAQGDHGGEEEAPGDALDRRPRTLGRRRGRVGLKTEVYALAAPPARGESVRIEADGNAAEQIVEFLAGRKLL